MDQGPIRILHIDDDVEFAEMASLLLQQHVRDGTELEVETEHSVSAGLDRLSEGVFDCVVSDYEMPGETGLDLLRAVRESYPDLPFVLFTGKGSEEIAAEAISVGVSDYLQKGVGTDQYAVLANRVTNLVSGYRNERELRQRVDAIETAREGISILDSDGTVSYTNAAFAETFGDDDITPGTDIRTLFVDDLFDEDIRPVVAEDGEWSGETVMRRPDGTELVSDIAVSRTAGDQFVCTIRDITGEEHREHDLFVKNRAMDAAPFGIIVTDPALEDNGIVYANEEFERLTGYSEAEIRGENCRFLQGPESDPEAVAEMRDAIAADEPVTVELRNYRKDGTPFWNRVTIAPIFDTEGTVTNYVGFQRDVDGEIEQRKEREAVLGRVSDAFFALDESWRFTYLNDQAESLLDRPREELTGETLWEEFPEAVGSTFDERYRLAMESQETVAFEEYYPPLNTWFEVRAYPSESGLSVYFRDISERKANERRLEQRTRQFETFGDVLSHDLQTPLATLDGRLELASKTGDMEHLDGARRSLERVRDLVEDLADVMREGSLVSGVEPVDLTETVRALWKSLDTEEASLTVEPVGRILADEQAVTRLLQNLLRNSVEHSSTGSQSPTDDSVEHGGDSVAVTVGALDEHSGFFIEDDGPGIPEDQRETVFEPGYSTKSDGTGFGLLSVRQIVLAHGWEIEVTESASGGARFEIHGVSFADD